MTAQKTTLQTLKIYINVFSRERMKGSMNLRTFL